MAGKRNDPEALFDARRDEQRHGKRDDQEREKRSWRELDRARDRSGSGGGRSEDRAREPEDRYQSATAQKVLKGELDALFEDKGAQDLRAAILAAPDRAALQEAMQACVDARGGLPSDDAGLIEKMLGARKDALLGHAVEAAAALLPTADHAAKRVLLLKLRSRSRTTFDRKVAARMKQVLAEHGAED